MQTSSLSLRKRILIGFAALAAVFVAVALRGFAADQIRHWWRNAIKWNINPWIYVALLFVTFYHYYKGWWLIATGLLRRNGERFRKGVVLNRAVWAVPYLYVVVFGRGYPWWLLAGVVGWLAFGLAMFYRRTRDANYANRMVTTFPGKYLVRLFGRATPEKESV